VDRRPSFMEVESLSEDPSFPCISLRFNDTRILLDCALDPRHMLLYLPPSLKLDNHEKSPSGTYVKRNIKYGVPFFERYDVASVDVVLISSYQTILALPFLTEHTGFAGRVFCTEPTMWIARQLLEEIVILDTQSRQHTLPSANAALTEAELRQLSAEASDALQHQMVHWRELYSHTDVTACLSKLEIVSYDQRKDVVNAVRATASRGGLVIGSANWIVETDDTKISYVAGAAKLSLHPVPLAVDPLRGCDAMILASLNCDPRSPAPDDSVGRLCRHIGSTLKRGGNVLVPTPPTGMVFDVLEALIGYLSSMGLGGIPQYMISPSAEQAIGYSSIAVEWLCKSKQDKAFVPESPFVHTDMHKSGILRVFPSAHDEKLAAVYREPCIIFASHPSLRLGEAAYFMTRFRANASNLLVLTDPHLDPARVREPFEPMAMTVVHCPIDTRLTIADATQLAQLVHPRHLIAPSQYIQTLQVPWNCALHPLPFGAPVQVPLTSQFQKATMSKELAMRIEPETVLDGISLSRVDAMANVMDHRLELHVPSHAEQRTCSREAAFLFGNFTLEAFAAALAESGIADFEVQRLDKSTDLGSKWDCVMLIGPMQDAKVYLSNNATHVETSNDALRTLLSSIIVNCLMRL